MMARAHFASLLLFGLLLAAPRRALASTTFPQDVKDTWQLPGEPPPCTLCHQTNTGGAGTATKYFARSLLTHGAMAKNDGSLKTALADLKSEGTDSDADGVSDYDELRAGSDPNDGPGAFADYPIPETGCSFVVRVRHADAPSNAWLLAAAGVFFRFRRRRSRGS